MVETPIGGMVFGEPPIPPIAGSPQDLSPGLVTNTNTFYAAQAYRSRTLTPDADITDGDWTNELDSNVNLYASIDEAAANDSDYIKSGVNPSADIAKIGLSNPGSLAMPFLVRYRYKKDIADVGEMNLTVRLMQGATQIAEWSHGDITDSFVDAEQALTLGEFNSITDVSDLNVEFEANFTP